MRTFPALAAIILASTSVMATEQWSGKYTGVNFGFGFNPGDNGELKFRRNDGSDNSAAINDAFGQNFDGKFNAGSILGAEFGHDWQAGIWVYGAAFDLSLADIGQEQSAFSATPASYVNSREVESLATLTGRIGWASNKPILPYFRLGFAYADIDHSWKGNSGAFQGANGGDNNIGYTAGLGAEFKWDAALSFALEYRYVNLGDTDFDTQFGGETGLLGQATGASSAFGTAAQGGSTAEGSDDDFDFQSVSLHMRYRF